MCERSNTGNKDAGANEYIAKQVRFDSRHTLADD